MAKIGLQYPVFAPITSEEGGAITYGSGVVMGRAVSANLTWETQDNKLYADDAVAETDNSITGYTLDIETSEMTEAVEAAVLGYAKVGSTEEYEVTDDGGPEGGCGYIQVLKRHGVLGYKAFWYPRIQFGVHQLGHAFHSRHRQRGGRDGSREEEVPESPVFHHHGGGESLSERQSRHQRLTERGREYATMTPGEQSSGAFWRIACFFELISQRIIIREARFWESSRDADLNIPRGTGRNKTIRRTKE